MRRNAVDSLHVTAKEDRIPVSEKVAYATSEVPNFMAGYLPVMVSKQVFNMTLGISPTFVTLALAFFRLVDAFTDPLVGWWSDRFRSRFGRRRPFMFVGVIGMALVIPFLFSVGRDWPHWQIMGWFVVFGVLLFFTNTLFNIPYQSLLLEMTPDYHERTSITAYRSIAGKVMGIAIGWFWYLTQLPIFADPETGQPDTLKGAQGLAFVAAGIILLTGFIPVFVCRERYYAAAAANKQQRQESIWRSMRQTLANRPFRLLLVIAVCLQIPQLVNGMAAYLNTYYFYEGEQKAASILTGWSYTLAQVCAIAAVPAIAWISRRWGKERTLRLIFLGNILVSIAFWIAYSQRDFPYLVLIIPLFNGPLISGLWMILPSMTADVVDHDELQTGERREGSFAAVFSWILKFGMTAMVALSGPILDLIGFDANLRGDQPEGVFLRMRVLLTLVPLIAVGVQLWVFWKYPLNQEVALEIREKLEARRGKVGS